MGINVKSKIKAPSCNDTLKYHLTFFLLDLLMCRLSIVNLECTSFIQSMVDSTRPPATNQEVIKLKE